MPDPEVSVEPLRGRVYGREPSEILAGIVRFDRRARLRRAAAVSLPLLGGALVSLPVPGWHLVGVPGCLLAAVIFGRRRLNQAFEIESLRGPCPGCGTPQEFPPPRYPGPEFSVRCPGCGEFLKLGQLR